MQTFLNLVGKLKMNPSRPPAIENNVQVRRGGFSRTAVGDSFTVSAVPIGPYIDIFPPCKIIDLDARMEDDKVILTWTAPGDDFDKGQGMFVGLLACLLPKMKDLQWSFVSLTPMEISLKATVVPGLYSCSVKCCVNYSSAELACEDGTR